MADDLGDYGFNKSSTTTNRNSASLTGFPLFVSLTDSGDTTGTGQGGLKSSASINGKEDIGIFDGVGNLIDYYWETFDTSSGVYEAWVNVDLTRDGSTTDIQIGYGSGSTDDSTTKSTVFGNVPGLSYRYDFNETSGTTANDTTGNNNDADYEGTFTLGDMGQFGNAVDLAQSGRIDVPDPTSSFSSYTILAWVNFPNPASEGTFQTIASYQSSNNNLHPGIDSRSGTTPQGKWRPFHKNGISSSTVPNANTWYLFCQRWDGSTVTASYDNTQIGTISESGSGTGGGGGAALGRRQDGTFPANAKFDEYHFYDVDKGQDWVYTHEDMSEKGGYTVLSWASSTATTPTIGAQTTKVIGTPKTASTTPSILTTTTTAKASPLQASTSFFSPGFSWESEQTMGVSLKSNTKPAQRTTFYRQGDTTGNDYFSLSTDSNGYLNVELVDNGAIINDFAVQKDILDGSWHRIAIRMNSAEELEVFIDGFKETTEQSQFTTVNSHGNIVFEQDDLYVDEFKRWTTDLTITEIDKDNKNFQVANADLFIWWSFDNPRLGERYTSKTTIK